MLENNWKNIEEMIAYSKGGILSKEIIKNEKLNVTLFCMAKGTQITEHTSTKEGVVYVLKGSGVFNLNESEIPMKESVFIHLEKNAPHSLIVNEDTSFLLALVN